uniref:Galactosyltransferase C-terminal domain-containing protein n=1 Tax=Timema poppense TaxID=170557 RepID=A0A7R9DEL6_TIMPO|nr:unnamed protein product [Timema poppensis]
MSSSVNTFRYNLPYRELFGGAVAILQKQFEFVNGFSNVFFGWGGEDDDFQGRISNKGMKMCRFEPTVARYVMLSHAKELPSEDRFVNLGSGRERFEIDGLWWKIMTYYEITWKSTVLDKTWTQNSVFHITNILIKKYISQGISTMGEDRLMNTALMNSEGRMLKDIDFNDTINAFAQRKARRNAFKAN